MINFNYVHYDLNYISPYLTFIISCTWSLL